MIDLLKNIINDRPHHRALMGLDIGKKTIGIALSDDKQNISMPLCTIKRTKFSNDIKKIEKLVIQYEVGGFVFGYPVNMDGSAGRRCQSVRDFALEFKAQFPQDLIGKDFWIGLWDERLSTNEVEYFLRESIGLSRRRAKEKGVIDKLAAQLILQGALDFIARNA